jgi:recombinase/recombinase-like zinc beta ribbon protein
VPRVGRAKRDKGEIIELVPGDPGEVEAVQTMFKMARDGVGYRSIAQYLNDRGIPSPDATRQRTIATVPGRWTSTTVRALLMNPAYVGDAIWNVRSSPKFHRLEGDKITPLDDFEQNRFRMNSKADWVIKRDAHPALIDRATFDAVQRRIQSNPSTTRGHVREYLLTGLITCADCGDIMVGTTRTRRKTVAGAEKVYVDPMYVCCGTLRAKGRCRQVGLPRDGFERAVLRIVDEELLRPEALARLEQRLRLAVDRRHAGDASDGIAALERRALDLKNRIAEGARRILQVGDEFVVEVKAAIGELKEELQRIEAAIAAKREHATLAADGEDRVRTTLDEFRTMSTVLRDPTFPLERRREALRRLLPTRDGVRPIRVEIHVDAPAGWRRALKRVVVRCLTSRSAAKDERGVGFLVAGAVADEAGQPDAPGWDPVEGLAAWERELGAEELEAEHARVGAEVGRWT